MNDAVPVSNDGFLTTAGLAARPDFMLGAASVSPSTRTIAGPGGAADVEPRVMQVLIALADATGQVVTRETLFRRCWGGVHVGDDSLNRAIGAVRRLAADIGGESFGIETIPRTGYRLTGALPAGEPPTIAVLPFANAGGDPDRDYFVEGMVDEIVTALTRIRALVVISSESSSALKDDERDEQQAAARVGVRYILTGSVRRSGSQIRVAARLVDTSRHAQIWSERFDYELKDVFELQDRVALAVAAALEPSIYEAEVRRAARQPLENLGSYDLYLRAAPLRATCRKTEVLQALDLLDQALALDANFAPALAQAAGCHSQIYANGWSDEPDVHRDQGLLLADRALLNGSEDASVLAQVANAMMDLDGDIARAIALADRAVALNPGSARAWFISGLGHILDHDPGAVARLETAARLDPISPLNDVIRAHIGVGLSLAGDYQAALGVLRATTHRSIRIHLILAAIYGYLGMAAESNEEIARFQRRTAKSPEEIIALSIPRAKSRAFLLDGLALGRAASPARLN